MTTSAINGRPTGCSDIEAESINTLRMLAMDQVAAAGSGHYGFPLGAGAIMHTLFARHLRFDPAEPDWANADRFVLSAGHGSAMLYAQLHLAGYDVTIDDLRRFRQWGSRTPGHPERGHTPGVTVTTGPLGQGIANAVGLAWAERHLRAILPEGAIDHRTWVLASDGDLMEGISFEAASLAGAWGLDRLMVVYDDNDVVIDSRAAEVIDPDAVCAAWAAVGWNVLEVADGLDVAALDAAFTAAAAQNSRPTLVRVRTRIGAGSPLEDQPASHSGAPSAGDLEATRAVLGPGGAPFAVSPAVGEFWRTVGDRGRRLRAAWQRDLDTEIAALIADGGRAAWASAASVLYEMDEVATPIATRRASALVLAKLSERLSLLVGGAADLAEATGAFLPTGGFFSAAEPQGRNLRFGVREHAMCGIVNGIAAHSILLPFGGTFLMFATYAMNSIRMAALQQLPSVFVLSHDSVLLGEDGPTHQPVEVLPALRAIPGLRVLRPADMAETIDAWRTILTDPRPTCLVLSRNDLPPLNRRDADGVAGDGAYAVRRAASPDVVAFATGSEVHVVVDAALLSGLEVTVVSVPDVSVLARWHADRWEELAPASVPRVLVEAAHPMSWHGVARPGDQVIGVTTFGASAPGSEIAAHYGLNAERVSEAMLRAAKR